MTMAGFLLKQRVCREGLTLNIKISAVLTAFGWLWLAPCHGAETTYVYSPDKSFVVAWFDTELGEPVGPARSILLRQLPHGDTPFSLVTSPRWTQAYWSLDSHSCLIVDAPDNGNVDTWLFVARDSTQSPAVRIFPLKPLEKRFYAHWDSKHPWRPGIEKVSWKNNQTMIIHALDNNGLYQITLKTDALNDPKVEPAAAKAEGGSSVH